ncbi:MAG: helix-hairpin-helix domain-containing protein [Burkholderiales bacterium]|nr:helix-hairpin-helix domain-containing protein [Burkholderiales bacterium]
MKRLATAVLAAALLSAPLYALDDKQAKKDVATATAKAPAADAKSAPMDINTATAKQLATLDGIGDARSAAIVKGRPYKGKDELVEKKIIPQDVYDKIKDKIIAKQKPEAKK